MTNATFFRRHRVAPSAYFDKTNSLSLSKSFFGPKKWRQNLKFKSLAAFLGHFGISKPRTINVDYTSVGTRIHGLLVTSSSYSLHDLNWSSILFCPPMVLVVLLGDASGLLDGHQHYGVPPTLSNRLKGALVSKPMPAAPGVLKQTLFQVLSWPNVG